MTSSRFIDIDPLEVRFTHSKIRPFYSGCGRRIEDTIQSINEGSTSVDDLPKITILQGNDGHMFSLNNRRLYTFKRLRELGALENRTPANTVNVRIKQALPRELKKYSVDACSLNCSIMHEKSAMSAEENTSCHSDGREDDISHPEPNEEDSAPKRTVIQKPKKCLAQPAPTTAAVSSFQDVLSNVPTASHSELKKAMKLSQQGKQKQSSAILDKLEKGGLIDAQLRSSIDDIFEES